MTLAWYGHLKLQESGTSSNWPLIGAVEGGAGVYLAGCLRSHC